HIKLLDYIAHLNLYSTDADLLKVSYTVMEVPLKKEKCQAVAVSNFTIRHLEELIEESEITPSVNQVEFHPFLYQKELLEYCQMKRIQVVAYSPLARGEKLKHPRIGSLAEKYAKTPAQLMIRWGLQHGLVVIPKSTREERIRENSHVFDFDISDDDMRSLDSLNEDLRLNWDPTSVP